MIEYAPGSAGHALSAITAQTSSSILWGTSYLYNPWANLLQKNQIPGKTGGEYFQQATNGNNRLVPAAISRRQSGLCKQLQLRTKTEAAYEKAQGRDRNFMTVTNPKSFKVNALVFFVIFPGICFTVDARVKAQMPDPVLKKAVGCLVSRDWVKDDIHILGLRTGQTAWIRYKTGPVPGTRPTIPNMMQVIIYSPDQKRGWLLLIRNDEDSFKAIRNGYFLTKYGLDWGAREGNGGLATYRAMSVYATEMAKQQAFRMRLVPISNNCQSED